MAIRSTRLYYNTGFKVGEVPDSPSLLNSCSYLDLESHWDYQDFFLSSIDCKVTWDQVKNADYLKYGNAYYYIVGIKMLNQNNARLFLQLDGLTSLGGPLALNYNGGIVHQAHTRSDSYLGNTIDPQIGCCEILRTSAKGQTIPVGGTNVVASTLDLSHYPPKSTDEINDAYYFKTDIGLIEDEEQAIVAVPAALPAALPTSIGSRNTTAGFGYYNANNAVVKANIKYLRDLGIEGALLYTYVVPNELVSTGQNGHITSIGTGNIVAATGLDTSITADYGSYNNMKTYTTYSKYCLQSVLSGDTQTYEVGDIASGTSIQFNILYDGQYGGRAYCYPVYYKGVANTAYNLVRGVKSLPWKDYPIVFDSMSGSQWAKNEYNLNKGDISRGLLNTAVNAGTGEGGLLSGIKTAASNILINTSGAFQEFGHLTELIDGARPDQLHSAPGNLQSQDYSRAKNRAAYMQKQVIAPDLSCSPALGLQNIWSQQFNLYHLYPTTSDLSRIDRYYTMYGYPMANAVFDKNMMSGRQYFNYIEASDISIVRNGGATNAGIAVREVAEAQLNAGVRIWHTLPQPVTSNPIV